MKIRITVEGQDEPIDLEASSFHIDLNPATTERRKKPLEWLGDNSYMSGEWDAAGYMVGMRILEDQRNDSEFAFGVPQKKPE